MWRLHDDRWGSLAADLASLKASARPAQDGHANGRSIPRRGTDPLRTTNSTARPLTHTARRAKMPRSRPVVVRALQGGVGESSRRTRSRHPHRRQARARRRAQGPGVGGEGAARADRDRPRHRRALRALRRARRRAGRRALHGRVAGLARPRRVGRRARRCAVVDRPERSRGARHVHRHARAAWAARTASPRDARTQHGRSARAGFRARPRRIFASCRACTTA